MGEEEEEAEFSEARKRKLQERMAALQQAQQLEAQQRALLLKLLEPSAYERMMNVKISSPKLYAKALQTLVYLAQAGQISGKIDEKTLVKLLAKMSERRETEIEFKRK